MTDLVVMSLERWDDVWRRNQHLVAGLLADDPALRVLFVEPPADPPAPSPASGSASSVVAAMVGLCQGRPSLAAPLRSAVARLEGDTLAIEVPEDFLAFATMHADELRDLARRSSGRSLVLKIAAGGAAPSADPAVREPAEDRRQTLRQQAEKEKAVQEALDLFDGRVVDVREAKTSREDA